MMVSFSVSNFRSFLPEQTLSLVASKRLTGSHEDHALPVPDSDEGVLRAAVLYGANGAGKSNLFKALRYLKSIALQPRDKSSGTGRERFRFAESAGSPTTFDIQFIANEKLYRFGLKINDERVLEEWLVRVSGSRESVIYERVTDASGKVTIDPPGLKNAGKKLQALATVGGPQNQSFLATVHVTLDKSDQGDELPEILSWFEQTLNLIAPDASFNMLGHLLSSDAGFSEFAGAFLKSASTGVDGLEILKTELTEDELKALLPETLVSKTLDGMPKDGDKEENQSVAIRLDGGRELLFERTDKSHYYRVTVQAAHEQPQGKTIQLELSDESDGTRRLLNLMPALHHLRTSAACYFIDEIDRSLHPILVWKFLDFFLKSCSGGRRQIIVTTHESNLLDLELLRRDEIWFAEKDREAATHLYSLADFKVRKDLEIRKHYLQGRFGAVPFLGDLDRLLVLQGKPE